ncbi:MAG: DNA repair protein RecN, partial [Spirochaetota bacterium]|nr:DNA repair protein RecN [Spirochaetota bacterium]
RDVLRSYKDSLDFSPDRIEEINQRLKIINDLKRKYGSTIADVIMHKTKCEKENEKYSQNLDLIEKLTDKIKQLEKESSDKVISLSKVRQKKAKDLEKQIEEELAFLGMDKATFRVEFRYVQDDNSYLKITDKGVKINEKGIDRVEFTFSANPGEIPRPLAKIASGGELSRVMLAMKTILTDMDEIETLLFDEVDAGIGGEIAVKVAKKIKSISNKRQVICITHSPQIASLSEHHYLVEKVFENNRTKTTITKLTDEEKVKDIARMLGGEKITEVSIQHARELIANK